jgi:dynein heavy chain
MLIACRLLRQLFAECICYERQIAFPDNDALICYRHHFAPEIAKAVGQPKYFVDFLRDPVVDPETGELVNAHPSFYEGIQGDLSDIRYSIQPQMLVKTDFLTERLP